MSNAVLILRPQPGADRTARRALAMGLSPIVAPLFTIKAVDWEAPDPSGFDALILTSANAPRQAGFGLKSLDALPCYAVGEATAAAAREAGLKLAGVGPGDSADLLEMIAAAGIRSALHLCGRENRLPARPGLEIKSIIVYVADALEALPIDADRAIEAGAVILLHSPRAASRLAALIGPRRAKAKVAAISQQAAEAGGPGWAAIEVASEPRDHALLEAAAKLCHTVR